MTVILYAIPGFFLLIALEIIVDRLRGTGYYRVNDAINSLSAGVLSRMNGIVRQLFPLAIYVLAYEHIALFTLDNSLWVWVAAFVLYDFFYYWNHRMGHEMSVLWAAHVVHHSSEEYNLTTALRQTSGSFFSWIFYLPMALLGFDPIMVATVGALNLVYQFWVHTRHVPKLGWFEWIFVSPSNHRVHHAQNRIYIDKNYGGVFILWDRLFGTFQEELDSAPVIFGIRSALHSWNPLWANLQVYSQLAKDSWRTKRWQDKLRVWFGRTGWRPDDVANDFPIEKTDLDNFTKFDQPLALSTKWYCVLQHSLTIVIALSLMLSVSNLTTQMQLAMAGLVVFSSVSLGWLMERRPSAFWLESAKNGVILTLAFYLPLDTWASMSLQIGSVVSLLFLAPVAKDILRPSDQANLPLQSES